MRNDIADQAQRYIDAGFKLHRTGHNGNSKAGYPGWDKEQMTMTAVAKYLDSHNSATAGIGGRPPVNILILDVDVAGGKQGEVSYAKLCEDLGRDLEDFCVCVSGSGGRHYAVLTDLDFDTVSKLSTRTLGARYPDIDIIKYNNYVLIPASPHPSGTFYEPGPGDFPTEFDEPLTELDELITDVLRAKEESYRKHAGTKNVFGHITATPELADQVIGLLPPAEWFDGGAAGCRANDYYAKWGFSNNDPWLDTCMAVMSTLGPDAVDKVDQWCQGGSSWDRTVHNRLLSMTPREVGPSIGPESLWKILHNYNTDPEAASPGTKSDVDSVRKRWDHLQNKPDLAIKQMELETGSRLPAIEDIFTCTDRTDRGYFPVIAQGIAVGGKAYDPQRVIVHNGVFYRYYEDQYRVIRNPEALFVRRATDECQAKQAQALREYNNRSGKKGRPPKIVAVDYNRIVEATKQQCKLDLASSAPAYHLRWDHQSYCYVADVATGIIVTDEGAYDVANRCLIPPCDDLFAKSVIPISTQCLEEDKEPELLFKILDDADIKGDDRMLIQEQIGCILAGHRVEDAMFIWVGAPGSGKSTIAGLVQRLIEGRTTSIDYGAMSGSFAFAKLANADFVIFNEFDTASTQGKANAVAKLKSLVGGDTVSLEKKGEDAYSITWGGNVLAIGNRMPNFSQDGGGMARRIKAIQFSPRSSKNIYDIDSKLWDEREAVVAWALKGYRRCLKRLKAGDKPLSSSNYTELVVEESQHIVVQWFSERCRVNPDKTTSLEHLYSDFCAWAELHLGVSDVTKVQFSRWLSHVISVQFGIQKVRRKDGIHFLKCELAEV